MRAVVTLIERYPLTAFFVLAYALSWLVYPLLQVSPLLGFAGLFGPAVAAAIVVAAAEGKSGLRDLLGRILWWRVGVRWYGIALALVTLPGYLTNLEGRGIVGPDRKPLWPDTESLRWHRENVLRTQ
jgi:hypothetical protein